MEKQKKQTFSLVTLSEVMTYEIYLRSIHQENRLNKETHARTSQKYYFPFITIYVWLKLSVLLTEFLVLSCT